MNYDYTFLSKRLLIKPSCIKFYSNFWHHCHFQSISINKLSLYKHSWLVALRCKQLNIWWGFLIYVACCALWAALRKTDFFIDCQVFSNTHITFVVNYFKAVFEFAAVTLEVRTLLGFWLVVDLICSSILFFVPPPLGGFSCVMRNICCAFLTVNFFFVEIVW